MWVLWHGVAGKGPCTTCMSIGEDIISRHMGSERSFRDPKKTISHFQEIPSNSTGNVEDRNKVAKEEDTVRGQELLKNNTLSTWPFFLKRWWDPAEYKDWAAIRYWYLSRCITTSWNTQADEGMHGELFRVQQTQNRRRAKKRNVIRSNTSAGASTVQSFVQLYWK